MLYPIFLLFSIVIAPLNLFSFLWYSMCLFMHTCMLVLVVSLLLGAMRLMTKKGHGIKASRKFL